jgi:hypothetical protein
VHARGSAGWTLTAHSSLLLSRCCGRALLEARRTQSRCSSRRGGTGAAAACWAATCCRCSLGGIGSMLAGVYRASIYLDMQADCSLVLAGAHVMAGATMMLPQDGEDGPRP